MAIAGAGGKSVVGKRYRLEEELGRGAMGEVYCGIDRLSGEPVALKRLSVAFEPLSRDFRGEGAELRTALSREFQVLAKLYHPYVIGIRDYGFDERRVPFFTMEYLPEARTLLEAGARQPDQIKVGWLVQLLQALAYLHCQGVVHRNLKPSNVLVCEGRVKVLDFGLAALSGRRREVSEFSAYRAPEVLNGAPESAAADLYAAGILAYVLFTGDRPEPEPDYSRPGILPELVPVLQRLLAEAPEARYSTARAAIAALGTALGGRLVAEVKESRPSYLPGAAFVGRDVELAQLTTALEAAIAKRGSVWLIGGESGVGKSRLLQELRTRALVQGLPVFKGRAGAEGGQPYQIWRDVARWLVIMGEPNDLEAGVLRVLLPDIETLVARPVPPAPVLDPQATQTRLLTVIMALLRRCTAQTPLVIWLEGMQWMGDNCLGLLQWIGWQIDNLPVLIVGSYREDMAPTLPERLAGTSVLRLNHLSQDLIASLSAAMLGEVGWQPDLVAFLQRETEGHIFSLVELLRALAEESELHPLAAVEWRTRGATGGVSALVQQRLNQVPEWAGRLLQLAAVTGRRIDPLVLKTAAPDEDFGRWLAACANAAVLEQQDQHWQFTHDRLREGVLEGLTANERQILYRRIARAIETVYAVELPAHASELAYYYREAREPERERHYVLLAGIQAAAQYANGRALNHLARALTLTPETDAPGRCSVLLVRVGIYDLLGRREQQMQDLEALTALADALDDPRQRAEVALRRAEYARMTGDYPTGAATTEEALALAQKAGAGDVAAQAWMNWGHVLRLRGEYEAAREQFERALAAGAGVPRLEAGALQGLGLIYWLQGARARARDYQERSLQLCQQTGDRQGTAAALNNLGILGCEMGEYEAARVRFGQALQIYREVGDQWGEGTMLGNLASVLLALGCYEQALDYCERALMINQLLRDQLHESQSLNTLSRVYFNKGDWSNAEAYARMGLEAAKQAGNRAFEAVARIALGRALNALGQGERAGSLYGPIWELGDALGEPRVRMELLAGLSEVALGQGDLASARERVEEILTHLQSAELNNMDNPFWVEWTCYRVLQAAEDPRAPEFLTATVMRLQNQADRIQDTWLRQSFLENVQVNRELLQAWQVERASG